MTGGLLTEGHLADWLDPPGDAARWAGDPAAWVAERLGGFLWSKQREVAASVAAHRYTAVHSCHDAGKSALAARLVCWWLDTRPPGDAFVVTTAPTWAQVKAILWREIDRVRSAAAHAGRPLPGRTTLGCEWRIGEELVGFGRKPADTDQSAFQGIHALHPLIVIDEAGGIPRTLWDAVDALATNDNARVLAVGNPDDPGSHFASVCRPGSGWSVVHIDGLTSPNFTKAAVEAHPALWDILAAAGVEPSTEAVPDWLRPLLLSPQWVVERAHRWGTGSPLWDAKVRGLFPTSTESLLIPPHLIHAALERELPGTARGRYGLDVARHGPDSTVLVRNRGGVVRVEYERHGQDTMTTADEVAATLAPHKNTVPVVVDAIGLGAGVFDRLRQRGLPAVPFVASERPLVRPADGSGEPRFANRRAEAWWAVREAFEAGEVDLDAGDEDLVAQVGSLRWHVDGRGVIHVEGKDEWRKRMGGDAQSPDHADALCYSFVAGGAASRHPNPTEEEGRPQRITAGLLDVNW